MKHYAHSWTWDNPGDEYDSAIITMIDGSIEALEERKKGGVFWSLSEEETRKIDERINILKEFKERFVKL